MRTPRICLLHVEDDLLPSVGEPHIAGLLRKTGDVLAKLPDVIRTVASGAKYSPPEGREAVRISPADPQAYFKILSDRELQLLPHFGDGAPNDDVAATLHLTVHTVKAHRQSILNKLNLHSTARLVRWTIRHGLARRPSGDWTAR